MNEGYRSVAFAVGNELEIALKRVAELEDLAYNRAPKLAAEELNRQKEIYEAQSAKEFADWVFSFRCARHQSSVRNGLRRIKEEFDARFERAEQAEAEAARLRAALEKVEWGGDEDDPDGRCAYCLQAKLWSSGKPWGHASGCVIGKALHPSQESADAAICVCDHMSAQHSKPGPCEHCECDKFVAACAHPHQARGDVCPDCGEVFRWQATVDHDEPGLRLERAAERLQSQQCKAQEAARGDEGERNE